MKWAALLGDVLVVAGLFFIMSAVAGVLRLPDFYTRLHALGKCDTLGVGLMIAGLAVRAELNDAIKMLVILQFVMIAGPTATHALARAAWRSGQRPWTTEARRSAAGRLES